MNAFGTQASTLVDPSRKERALTTPAVKSVAAAMSSALRRCVALGCQLQGETRSHVCFNWAFSFSTFSFSAYYGSAGCAPTRQRQGATHLRPQLRVSF